jgi:hypothetical protein
MILKVNVDICQEVTEQLILSSSVLMKDHHWLRTLRRGTVFEAPHKKARVQQIEGERWAPGFKPPKNVGRPSGKGKRLEPGKVQCDFKRNQNKTWAVCQSEVRYDSDNVEAFRSR